MLTVEQLLDLDPSAITDTDLEGWTTGGHPDQAPLKRRPLTTAVTNLHDAAYARGGQARGLANQAKTEIARRLVGLAPAVGGNIDTPREQERSERDLLREFINLGRFLQAVLAAEPANRHRDGENQRWPALPAPIKRSPSPLWDASQYKPFDVAGWCNAHAKALLDSSKVRVIDADRGRLGVRAGAFSADDMSVVAEHEAAVAAWVSAQFAPFPPRFT